MFRATYAVNCKVRSQFRSLFNHLKNCHMAQIAQETSGKLHLAVTCSHFEKFKAEKTTEWELATHVILLHSF